MASSSQTAPAPAATINAGGTTRKVNLRDYLNIRVAPFLKKAITESLDAAPEYPLQWLGEHLIRQSMLFEGNPDATNISERFFYKFNDVSVVPISSSTLDTLSAHEQSTSRMSEPVSTTNSVMEQSGTSGIIAEEDTHMSNHVNGIINGTEDLQAGEIRDTEMAGAS